MENTKKKSTLFAKIESKEDALKMIKESAIGFIVIAFIQGIIGIFLSTDMIIDGVLFLMFALILMKYKSRIAAFILALLSIAALIVTSLNNFGVMHQGGTNIILAIIMLITSARAVEATFKLKKLSSMAVDALEVTEAKKTTPDAL